MIMIDVRIAMIASPNSSETHHCESVFCSSASFSAFSFFFVRFFDGFQNLYFKLHNSPETVRRPRLRSENSQEP